MMVESVATSIARHAMFGVFLSLEIANLTIEIKMLPNIPRTITFQPLMVN